MNAEEIFRKQADIAATALKKIVRGEVASATTLASLTLKRMEQVRDDAVRRGPRKGEKEVNIMGRLYRVGTGEEG